jgi:hypothetical protein
LNDRAGSVLDDLQQAVDAADNAVTAAHSRAPVESCFVHDFVLLERLPQNVRFLITARTARLPSLRLPAFFERIEIAPFSRSETAENVARFWSAPSAWTDDFHFLSAGIPRVQAYAFQLDAAHPSAALDHLRPNGKSLSQVFRDQFEQAVRKGGNQTEVTRLCAALITLPRPVPLEDLAGVMQSNEAQLSDLCADLAPGIQLQKGMVSFADEDFEEFVRHEATPDLPSMQQAAASWLLSRASYNVYAALNVAQALASASRGGELLELVERESAPAIVVDPVMRREAEVQRLRLAIKVSREAADVPHALRFVLIGAEGIKTEAALRELLTSSPDMAAAFAQDTSRRLILADPELIEHHGPLLFQKLSVDAQAGDAISVREGRRLIRAWLNARKDAYDRREHQHTSAWSIGIEDIASSVRAALLLEGPSAAIRAAESWTPRSIAVELALSLPYRLLAEGRGDDVEALAAELTPVGRLLLLLPLALAGRDVDLDLIEEGLNRLARSRLDVRSFLSGHRERPTSHGLLLEAAITASEILTLHDTGGPTVDRVLDTFLNPETRRIDQVRAFESHKLDLIFRAYALRELRAGRTPAEADIFTARPEPSTPADKQKMRRIAEDQDRAIRELTTAFFSIYAARAAAFLRLLPTEDGLANLRRGLGKLSENSWRISRQHEAPGLRVCAANSVLALFAVGYEPRAVMSIATEIHGYWLAGGSSPDARMVARLSVRGELHDSLIHDLAQGATRTSQMRIGANRKSTELVSYARHLHPISPRDANAIFNDAVQAASELDREAMSQLWMLNSLFDRGVDVLSDRRETALAVSEVIADAAIRLEDHDEFPWNVCMSILGKLDPPLAIANAARWDDASLGTLRDTLRPLLLNGMRAGFLRSQQASALALFLVEDPAVHAAVIGEAKNSGDASLPVLAEEAACSLVLKRSRQDPAPLEEAIGELGTPGVWLEEWNRQRRLESFAQVSPAQIEQPGAERTVQEADRAAFLAGCHWPPEVLIDPDKLVRDVRSLQEKARSEHIYLSAGELLLLATRAVPPRHRTHYLSALAAIEDISIIREAVKSLLHAIEEWKDSPAVKSWCRAELPSVITDRLPELIRYLHYDSEDLSAALGWTVLSPDALQDVVLQGIERHVDSFGSDQIFRLVGLMGSNLAAADSCRLADWYAKRLADRIPQEQRDQRARTSDLPSRVDDAVARFLFSYLGDFDLRMRWRAAHAVRRLARTGDTRTLEALLSQYERRLEPAFRDPELAFYWNAARLWFVLAWDRVAAESPEVAAMAGELLFSISTDETYPHVLVREFARDACEKLLRAGRIKLSKDQRSVLAAVNQPSLERKPEVHSDRRHFHLKEENRRFEFDSMDTLPYWYEPMLHSFADLSGDEFLEAVEHWIIDQWGYKGDIRAFDKEPRHRRFENRDWRLSMHRQGSTPTLERLNTHLEWHGMWCAVGDLMRKHPLVLSSDEDSWSSLYERIRREKLSEPPLWSADLLAGTPLIERNWRADSSPVESWALAVSEPNHRAEIFPGDRTGYIVVDQYTERRSVDRVETIRISSALTDPLTYASLLRTLQTMNDSWDYKLPNEDEDCEINHPPFVLAGWLRHSSKDVGIDEKDPFRGYASSVRTTPGKRVCEALSLAREESGAARWRRSPTEISAFLYESWGTDEGDDDDRHYSSEFKVFGERLLVHRLALADFLRDQKVDLVVEVEVNRSGRKDRRFSSEEEKSTPEGRFDRVYSLRSNGDLDVAEGCLGSW